MYAAIEENGKYRGFTTIFPFLYNEPTLSDIYKYINLKINSRKKSSSAIAAC